jgi:nucleotide-binding universal stress UspA family protein
MSEAKAAALPGSILVALDFSQSARRALELALTWVPNGEITALHVVDTAFAARVEATGLATRADVLARLRQRATEDFGWLAQEKGAARYDVMVVEGVPFVEIVKIASDLDVDMIMMGKHQPAARVDDLLGGGTTERVLRACRCPVVCVP